MARGRKKAKRRRAKTISLLNLAESYAYASILTEGVAGTTPYNLIVGGSDLAMGKVVDVGIGQAVTLSSWSGTDQITLTEMVTNPDVAFSTMSSNFMSNWQNMVVKSFAVSVGFRVGKRLLRRPLSNVSRNIFKPLGLGVRL